MKENNPVICDSKPQPAIEIQKMSKHYDKGIVAVDNLSLSIPDNSTYALLGPNGAGKTTTISILTTMAIPTHGFARVYGFDVVNNAAEVRRTIGVTFQQSISDDALSLCQMLCMTPMA